MNFFRDEKGAREILGDWMDDPNMYFWPLKKAQEMAFGIFGLRKL